MKFFRLAFICFGLLFISYSPLLASHIIGGEISYTYLGNFSYLITFRIYRDCGPNTVPLDNPAAFTIFNGANQVFDSVQVPLSSDSIIPIANPSPCLTIPPGVCLEEGTYLFMASLPPTPGGYTITYQRCCRNAAIINIANPATTGVTYFVSLNDSTIKYHNNSPVFKNYPATFVCANNPLSLNHSAYDPDGDSLVYALAPSYNGASAINSFPQVDSPPPYKPVTYVVPYTYTNPVPAALPLTINPQTGQLTVTPNRIGRFEVSIGVTEYRHGILLGTYRRDVQLIVVNCVDTTKINAQFTAADTALNVTFNSSGTIGAVSYAWDFGDGHTDTAANAKHAYSTGGYYPVCLTITASNSCTYTLCRQIAVGNVTGVQNVKGAQLSIYPNPAGEQLTVGSKQLAVSKMEITDLLGRTILLKMLNATETKADINISQLPQGVYLLNVIDTDGNKMVRKFVKE